MTSCTDSDVDVNTDADVDADADASSYPKKVLNYLYYFCQLK